MDRAINSRDTKWLHLLIGLWLGGLLSGALPAKSLAHFNDFEQHAVAHINHRIVDSNIQKMQVATTPLGIKEQQIHIAASEARTETYTKGTAPAYQFEDPIQPPLNDDEQRINGPLPTGTSSNGNWPGPVWRELQALVDSAVRLELQSNATHFKMGQELVLKLDILHPGYLNIITVDRADMATVLYPNRWHQNNQVETGPFELSGEALRKGNLLLEVLAQPPAGPWLVLAFLSNEDINLFRNGKGSRNDAGELIDSFAQLSESGTKDLIRSRRYAGWVELQVLP